MPLRTKGNSTKIFRHDREAIEWAEKQFSGAADTENREELARFRLMVSNVPSDFWNYPFVEAHFDSDGHLNHFVAKDKDKKEVRRY
jgi:hypothetical protein